MQRTDQETIYDICLALEKDIADQHYFLARDKAMEILRQLMNECNRQLEAAE